MEVKKILSPLKQWKYPLWLYGLILFVTSLITTGYRVYYGNQAITIPLMQIIRNPGLFPNDPYAATLVNYSAPIWRVLAVFTDFIPVEIILLLLFLFTRALVIFAAGHLALTISPGNTLAAVGAMAFFALWPISLVGHGTLLATYFEQTSLSIAFFLLAAGAFYARRTFWWAFWLAIGFNLNSMYGAYACTYFAAAFLADPDYRCNWKDWIFPILVFGALIAPTVWLTFTAFQTKTGFLDLWLLASQARFPMHLYPRTWPRLEIIIYFFFVIAAGLILYFHRRVLPQLSLQGIIWIAVSIAWVAYAYFAAYSAKSASMLIMHPARATDLMYAFIGISVVTLFAHQIKLEHPQMRLYTVSLFAALFWQKFIDDYFIIFTLWAVISILVYLPATWKSIFRQGKLTRLSNIVILISVLFGLFVFSQPPLSMSLTNLMLTPDPQIYEIADWAKANTSTGDMFLVVPNWSEFRALAQRPVFVTYKDGAAMLWQRDFVEEWVPRMEHMGYDFENPEATGISTKPYLQFVLNFFYEDLDDGDIAQLIKGYPLKYWVVSNEHVSRYPVVFTTEDYKVLELKAPQ